MTIIDRFGMRAPAVLGAALPSWADSAPPPSPRAADACHPTPSPPAAAHTHLFPYAEHINRRFAIWQGDISTLEVDAICNTTDESLTECNAVSERIMQAAGPGLKEEIITRGYECHTGEVVVTGGHGLRCRRVLHTVSPKYVAKFHSAAEGSLHNCYKNVLYKAGETCSRSLALCVISTPRRNFPPDVAAHVALRTIRRYLEHNQCPHSVVLCSNNGAELSVFVALAPLYFPRSEREAEMGARRIAGGEVGPRGETVVAERRIRIIHNPHEQAVDTADDDTSLYDEDAATEAAAALSLVRDTQRLLAPDSASRATPIRRDAHPDHQVQ